MRNPADKSADASRSPTGIQRGAVGYVLVGGASSRFGADKALAQLDGRPMYARMTRLLGRVGLHKICLVGDPALYGNLGFECIPDRWPGEGPLGGIVTAIHRTEAMRLGTHSLIVSCDMPFLTEEFLEYLLERAVASDSEVVLARSLHGLEPLCAVWRTTARPAIEEQFQEGVRKVTQAIGTLSSEVLDERDWKRFDTAGRLFWNMNTQADYEEARRIVKAEAK
jgi:molybdopterin-guanine dinucleotide biosynthesis protein A